jgi:putative colanic acid biosynthesis acetyltransferase WcaF
MNRVRNDLFNARVGLERGRPAWVEGLWWLTKCIFFLTRIPWPNGLKRRVLVLFGARIGEGLVMRPRVNVHFPWKLVVGDHCWIGYDCDLLNYEAITLGDHVAIAHRVFLTTGNHDYKHHAMAYRNEALLVGSGTWIASCAFIGPGVTIGEHCVVAAGSVVTKSVPAWSVVRGNPAQVIRRRVLER